MQNWETSRSLLLQMVNNTRKTLSQLIESVSQLLTSLSQLPVVSGQPMPSFSRNTSSSQRTEEEERAIKTFKENENNLKDYMQQLVGQFVKTCRAAEEYKQLVKRLDEDTSHIQTLEESIKITSAKIVEHEHVVEQLKTDLRELKRTLDLERTWDIGNTEQVP